MRFIYALLFLGCLVSCADLKEKTNQPKPYFDLPYYFKKEAARLRKQNPQIEKTVQLDGKPETKTLKIGDWEREFNIFIDADINKAAWRGLFKKVEETKGETQSTIYSSNSKKIPIKKIAVQTSGGKVLSVKVWISNVNDLYTSQEELSYFPDSLYHIKKAQNVRLMGEKKFEISGKF